LAGTGALCCYFFGGVPAAALVVLVVVLLLVVVVDHKPKSWRGGREREREGERESRAAKLMKGDTISTVYLLHSYVVISSQDSNVYRIVLNVLQIKPTKL